MTPSLSTTPTSPASQRSGDDSPLLYREHIEAASPTASETDKPLQKKPRAVRPTTPPPHDIYFSVSVHGSKEAVLSDRLPTPPFSPSLSPAPLETPTPTQSSFDAELTRGRATCSRHGNGEPAKMRLTPQHVERLTRAYIAAPFFRDGLCVKRVDKWEIRDTSATTTDFQGAYVEAKLLDVALTDTKKQGEPLRFATAKTWVDSNVLNVGCQTFLNAPFGEDFDNDCTFRVEAPTPSKPSRVIMSIIHPVLSRWDGDKIFHLITDLDVTAIVTTAVLAELAQQSEVDASAFSAAPASLAASTTSSAIDWIALADDLQLEYELDSFIDTAVSVFCTLQAHPRSPPAIPLSTASLILLTSLTSLKLRHRDFLILSTLPRDTPGEAPSRIGVPWISAHFEWTIHEEMRLSEPRRRKFREDVVGVVAKKAAAGKKFEGTVELRGRELKVVGVPLVALDGDREAWVVFVG